MRQEDHAGGEEQRLAEYSVASRKESKKDAEESHVLCANAGPSVVGRTKRARAYPADKSLYEPAPGVSQTRSILAAPARDYALASAFSVFK